MVSCQNSPVNSIRVRVQSASAKQTSAVIDVPGGGSFDVSTQSNYTLDHSATPWLAPALAAGMRRHRDLVIDGTVDPTALDGATKAQKVLADWYRTYRRIEVSAAQSPPTRTLPERATGVGCFFSGGVDSFYSAITQADRITHLIFVHGFDIAVGDSELARKALTGARASAAELGKPLIEVQTTVRSALGDPLALDWGHVFHGPSLAHVGLALSKHLGTVVIPSSYSRDQLHPWGSHPSLDPLWSSDSVSFEHHELDVGRFGKIRRISSSDTAMNNLRVCWLNTDGAFNCGECGKCVRTKLGLRTAGVESPTLPGSISPEAVRTMYVSEGERTFLREGLAAMQDAGIRDEALTRALRYAIRRSYVRRFIPFSR